MPAKSKSQSNSGSLKNSEPVVVKPEPLKILLEWKSPGWLFKKRSREFFTTVGAIIFLVILILLLLQEWFLIVVIIALAFTAYILNTVKPQEAEHKITNRGLETSGRKYAWDQLGRFWIVEKWGQAVLHVEALVGLPRRLTLILGQEKKSKVKDLLSEYLLYEVPEKTWSDKAGEWLSSRVPLESSE
jgi:hypothetical protein